MNRVNKILITVLVVVVIITAALISLYLYNQRGSAKNGIANISQNTPSPSAVSQDSPAQIPTGFPFIFNSYLVSGTIGKGYETVIKVGVYNLNVQISGRVASGLPSGLEFTSCQTEYNSPELTKIAAKNSLAKCTIKGTPQESGEFTVSAYFSIPGDAAESYKDLPLTIFPQSP